MNAESMNNKETESWIKEPLIKLIAATTERDTLIDICHEIDIYWRIQNSNLPLMALIPEIVTVALDLERLPDLINGLSRKNPETRDKFIELLQEFERQLENRRDEKSSEKDMPFHENVSREQVSREDSPSVSDSSNDNINVTMSVNTDTVDDVRFIKNYYGLKSRASAVRLAIKICALLVHEIKNGGTIFVQSKTGSRFKLSIKDEK